MGCGQCRPGDGLRPPPRAWTTLRVAHTAHSPDDGVVLFSMIKWPCFQLSRFSVKRQLEMDIGDN